MNPLAGGVRRAARPDRETSSTTGPCCRRARMWWTLRRGLALCRHRQGLLPGYVSAEPAALLLDGVIRRLGQDEVIAQLRDAVESRTVIGRATGIMARSRCGSDEALNELIKISNDRNIKLREVAQDAG